MPATCVYTLTGYRTSSSLTSQFQSLIDTVQAPSVATLIYLLWTLQIRTMDGKSILICCIGDEGRCKTLLPLSIIEGFASPVQLARMFKNSFRTPLEQYPNEYGFCPAPDSATFRWRTRGLSRISLIRPRRVPTGRTILDWLERKAH